MAHDVFISHSSDDKVIADAVTAAVEQAGIRCWIAPRDIRPGDSWGGSIVDAIGSSRVMIVIFSARSNDSKQVMREVERAVQLDVVVVPFRIEDVQPSRDMEYFLSATHWLDAMSPEMGDHLTELVTTLQSILERPALDDAARKTTSAKKTSVRPVTAPKSGSGAKLGLAAVALLAVLGGGWFLFGTGGDEPTSAATSSTPVPSQASVSKSSNPASGVDTDRKLEFSAPQSADSASEVTLEIKGEADSSDYVVIAKSDANDSVTTGYKRVGSASSLTLVAPPFAGDYQIRYYDGKTKAVIARSALKLSLPEVTLKAPDSGVAGTSIKVHWTAPNYKGDYLSVAIPAAAANAYKNYAQTRKGSPTEVRLPDEEGDYEVRYIPAGGKTIWAKRPLKVTRPEVTLQLQSPQVAGKEVLVKWQGPANKSDYLTVARPESPGKEYVQYKYVKAGTDTKLKMPEEVGAYEVRYVSSQAKLIWAKIPVEITQPAVSVAAPTTASTGQNVAIKWQGPANQSDLVTIADKGSQSSKYYNYAYARAGKDLSLQMPDLPGTYEIRYVSAQKKLIWATADIKVEPRTESLTHAAKVGVGERFHVQWQAQGGQREWIGIFAPDSDNSKQLTYAYTAGKTKTQISAPKQAGTYELRYVSSKEKLTWAKSKLVVE